ncbi:MAG: tetratricopeptide repeat protein [Candidatus Methylomirabilales bacterium]
MSVPSSPIAKIPDAGQPLPTLAWSVLLLTLVVPWAIWPAASNIYISPKQFVIGTGILAIVLMWFLQSGCQGRHQIPWTPYSLPAIGFLGFASLSLTQATDIYSGIDAVYRLLLFVILFHVASLPLSAARARHGLAMAMMISTGPVAIYGFLQQFGIDFLRLSQRYVPVGTIGNTGHVAEYLILTIPLGLAWFSTESRRPIRVGVGLLLCLASLHLILTKSRGGWVAALGSLTVMGLCLAWGRSDQALGGRQAGRRILGWGLVWLGLIVVASVLIPGLWQTVGQRVLSIWDLSEVGVRVRLLIWQSTLSLIRDHPLLGIGAGNFGLAYAAYRPAEEWRLSAGAAVMEAHNDFLHVGAEIGIFGLICFLWLLGRALHLAWRSAREAGEPREALWATGALGSLVAFTVYAGFGFPLENPTSGLYFWLLISLVSSLPQGATGQAPVRLLPARSALLLPLLLSLVLAGWPLVLGQFQASLRLREVKRSLARGDEEAARAAYQEAIDWYFPIFYIQQLRAEHLDERRFLPAVLEEYRALLRQRPDDPDLLLDLGVILGKLGKYDEAVVTFRRAIAIVPGEAAAHENLGFALLHQHKYFEAVHVLRAAVRLEPQRASALAKLGAALYKMGERAEAIAVWRRALELDPGMLPVRSLLETLPASPG